MNACENCNSPLPAIEPPRLSAGRAVCPACFDRLERQRPAARFLGPFFTPGMSGGAAVPRVILAIAAFFLIIAIFARYRGP